MKKEKSRINRTNIVAIIVTIMVLLGGCGVGTDLPENGAVSEDGAIEIVLSDDNITVDGKSAGVNSENAVYTANDIIYYESGKDFTYGEGTEKDAHTKAEADAHTVVHITNAGTYSLSGTLSKGQIAVDLGENAEEDPEAVVTLILNGIDVTCQVAPAIIFYNVYECGSTDTESATKDVDTSSAGANVIIADGTQNFVNGSYVERIYKPDTVVLNDDKTEVEDAEKLHKYDGAFYSKMSMNINGGEQNTGVLNISAENEGLDSELHLTINGGKIRIESGNDGINTNEDGVSVTTINGGDLNINVTGETGEGDGIDSNGWLVINDGIVTASACSTSADAGIDSDMGIHINGGSVIATGSMLDRIEDGGQTYAVFNFAQKQKGADMVTIKTDKNQDLMHINSHNDYSVLIFSSPDLVPGTYTLWSNDKQLAGQRNEMMGLPNMKDDGEIAENPMQNSEMPEGNTPPEPPEGGEFKEFGDFDPSQEIQPRNRPEISEGEAPQMPEGAPSQQMPQDANSKTPDFNKIATGEISTEFEIQQGGNTFSFITLAQ